MEKEAVKMFFEYVWEKADRADLTKTSLISSRQNLDERINLFLGVELNGKEGSWMQMEGNYGIKIDSFGGSLYSFYLMRKNGGRIDFLETRITKDNRGEYIVCPQAISQDMDGMGMVMDHLMSQQLKAREKNFR